MKAHLREELDAIERDGLFKKERVITSVQDAVIRLEDGSEVLADISKALTPQMLSSLKWDDPKILAAAKVSSYPLQVGGRSNYGLIIIT